MKLAAKSVFAVFFLLSSIYGLLAFVPFTFQQVIKGQLFPPLNEFGALQPYLYWFVLLIVTPAIGVATTRASTVFLVVHILFGCYLLVRPVLIHLENSETSMVWGVVFLVPIVWLTALDWLERFPLLKWGKNIEDEERPAFQAA